jgi:fermentation-respiration switch protein FrsA (DUF1100 family)
VAIYGSYDDFPTLLRALLDERLPRPLRGWAARTLLPMISMSAGDDLSAFAPGKLAAGLWPRPLLVLHGRGDSIIPFSQGRALFREATFPKDSLWLPTDHTGAYKSRYGAEVLLQFFDSAAPLPAI